MTRTHIERGFSLVEVLTALFIMSVAVVFATLVVNTVNVTRNSMLENVAFRIADSKINELRAGGYAALPAGGPFSDTQLASLPQGAASTTITALNAKVKEVTAGVSWFGADGEMYYVLLATLITESGGL